MSDFEVTGAAELRRVSGALKRAGQTEVRKAGFKGLRDGAKPLIPAARAAARSKLPQRGGLAADVARAAFRVRVSTGREAGVSIVSGKRRAGAARTLNDSGFVRHPVFGGEKFVRQEVPDARGWFDDEMKRKAPGVRPELERTLSEMAEQIVRDAR